MQSKKTIFIYGLVMALVVIILKFVEYKYLTKGLEIDIYMGALALVFTVLGIWVGLQFVGGPKPKNNLNQDASPIVKSLNIRERELEVLQLMAEGLSNQEIADRLFISIHTVKTHSSNLFGKLKVRRRTQAIQKAKKLGILPQ